MRLATKDNSIQSTLVFRKKFSNGKEGIKRTVTEGDGGHSCNPCTAEAEQKDHQTPGWQSKILSKTINHQNQYTASYLK